MKQIREQSEKATDNNFVTIRTKKSMPENGCFFHIRYWCCAGFLYTVKLEQKHEHSVTLHMQMTTKRKSLSPKFRAPRLNYLDLRARRCL